MRAGRRGYTSTAAGKRVAHNMPIVVLIELVLSAGKHTGEPVAKQQQLVKCNA